MKVHPTNNQPHGILELDIKDGLWKNRPGAEAVSAVARPEPAAAPRLVRAQERRSEHGALYTLPEPAPQPRDFPRELRGTEVTAAGSDGGGGSAGRGRGHEQPPAGDPRAAEAPPPAPGAAGTAGAGGPGRAGPGGPRRDFVFPALQLGAENADSIGAVLNSKDEQREIAETRETCRSVSGGVPVQNWGLRAGTGPGDAVGLHLVKENPIISQIRAVTGTSRV